MCTIKYYAERMSASFNLEIKSEYFGNCSSLSIKGYNIDIIDKELNGACEVHSHLSDDNRQDASKMIYVANSIDAELLF